MSFLAIQADARRIPLADRSMHCVVTSPPYFGLRDYGVEGQIGLEPSPDEFVAAMVEVFREVRRVLRDDGTLWLNIGDSYNAYNGNRQPGKTTLQGRPQTEMPALPKGYGLTSKSLKPKDLMLIPPRVALALQADGWYVRQECIWAKRNCMPESVRDRPVRSHEQVYLLSKRPRYYYDDVATRKPQKTLGKRHEGKSGYRDGHPSKGGIAARALNPLGAAERSVWPMSSRPFKGAHFATMPPDLAEKCIRLGTSAKGCCPACGAPWHRVVERRRVQTRPDEASKYAPESERDRAVDPIARDRGRHVTAVIDAGWRPGCACPEHRPVPCRVFDPFGGALTTCLAAEALGRDSAACDLSLDYLRIGVDRLSRPHAARVKPPASLNQSLPLFMRRSS